MTGMDANFTSLDRRNSSKNVDVGARSILALR